MELTVQALPLRRRPPGVAHHSDRGVQYASAACRALLATHGLTSTMSRNGDWWESAVVERVFAILQNELRQEDVWATWAVAQRVFARYIDGW